MIMDYEQIKLRLAPCGLHCGKCFAFKKGDIAEYSQRLKESLGEFSIYAKRFVDLLDEPAFGKYTEFEELLNLLANPTCGGCRIENCFLYKDCNVRDCHINEKVDYCFECSKFPCSETGFDDHLLKRSIKINRRMKEIGVVNYYNEIRNKPRY